MMQINIQNLTMNYSNGKQALTDVSLDLQSPNLVGLLGPNGAGKSTLMKLLVAGLLPTTGFIKADGIGLLKQEKQFKARLGYLPQTFGLYNELTVWQFLDYMAALKGIRRSHDTIRQSIEDTGLTGQTKTRIRTLSGGQRQRVGIAQALLGNPEFMIFDEPTVGLDPEERIRFRNLFSKTAQDKLVLLSTHIIEDVQSVCNRLVVMNQGKILFAGLPEALIQAAEGHVFTYLESGGSREGGGRHVTSRVNTAAGVACRGVAEVLPPYAKAVEPTLEDAYIYLLSKEETIL